MGLFGSLAAYVISVLYKELVFICVAWWGGGYWCVTWKPGVNCSSGTFRLAQREDASPCFGIDLVNICRLHIPHCSLPPTKFRLLKLYLQHLPSRNFIFAFESDINLADDNTGMPLVSKMQAKYSNAPLKTSGSCDILPEESVMHSKAIGGGSKKRQSGTGGFGGGK